MSDQFISGCMWGLVIGVLVTLLFFSFLAPPLVDDVKIFEQEQLRIIRLYKPGIDVFFVEDKNNPGKYISLGSYTTKFKEEIIDLTK